MRWRRTVGVAVCATVLCAWTAVPRVDAVGARATIRPDATGPWVLGATANPGLGPELHAVSCVSASFCVAVGTTAAQFASSATLVEQWDGTVWTRVDAPDASNVNVLQGVSCVSVSRCVAVGWSSHDGIRQQPLAEAWNGSAWSLVRSLTVPYGGSLTAVSCTGVGQCIAVGSEVVPSGFSPAIALQWNGKMWSRITLPKKGTTSNALDAVSCVGTSCVAVGSWVQLGTRRPLTVRDNGASWSSMQSPPADASDENLSAVSCVAVSSCVALGNGDTAFAATLTTGGWQLTPSPAAGTATLLGGVSCVSATACTAVGTFAETGAAGVHPLITSWSGTGWTQVSAPDAANVNDLAAVSCRLAAGCVAAGDVQDATGAHSTLVESNLAGMHTTAVMVPFTSEDLDRLAAFANEFGQTPQAFLNSAMGAMGYLLTVLQSDPTPITLPPAGTAATYVAVFDPNTVAALQAVEHKFALSPSDAVRASVYITEYLVVAGGG